jgi:hypothetical protein
VWRRDSDLAKQAGAPYDNSSAIYTDFTRNLRVALTESKVTVLSNLTILIEDYEGENVPSGVRAAFDVSSTYISGTVEAADGEDDGAIGENSSSRASVSALSSDAQVVASSLVMVAAVVGSFQVLV